MTRWANLVWVLAAACGGQAPEAHPFSYELDVRAGKPNPVCAESGWFEGLSARDTALTAVERKESTWPMSCAVPVDGLRERLLILELGCALVGDERVLIDIDSIAADGARFYPIQLELDAQRREARRSFGAGLPLVSDLEIGGLGGQAHCWFSGIYVRTTDAAKLFGPYRLVSHHGTYTPNLDRR